MLSKYWTIFSEIKDERFYKPLRVTINSATVKIGPPLSPILILNKLDADEFCRLSNELSSFLLENIPVSVFVKKNFINDFIIDIKLISFIDLIDWLVDFEFNKKHADLIFSDFLLLYKIFFLRSFLSMGLSGLFNFILSFLGTLQGLFPGFLWVHRYAFSRSYSD